MDRYLVVANQTLGGEPLLATIRELAHAGPCSFRVVVPATRPQGRTWTEGDARAAAQSRLDVALARFGDLGVQFTGDVGDANPILAIDDAIREHGPFDRIVLSTLAPGASRWLRLDLPHRVEAQFGLPVRHVIGEAERIDSTS
jgi:GABA permease